MMQWKDIIIGCCVFCLITLPVYAQVKQTGKPLMINYQRGDYQASTQNWSITQAANGFMYFGNNDGILEYDGTSWSLYRLNNQSVVRALFAVGDTIYAGGFEEIGYLSQNENGHTQWTSLKALIPAEFRNFDEVWRIFKEGKDIVFQSFSSILIYDTENKSIAGIKPYSNFGFMFQTEHGLLVADKEKGLFRVVGDTLRLISNDRLFLKKELSSVFSLGNNQFLIGTIYNGLFLFEDGVLSSFDVPVNSLLKSHSLFSALRLESGYVFGTISNGVYITDKKGVVLQHLNRLKGLQNNTVLSTFKDKRHNLWLGLDNGIDYVEINSSITLFDHNIGIESTYSVILHKGILYVGTNQGLYAANYNEIIASVLTENVFRLIPGTEGQVWTLQVIEDDLFCGHNFGAFLVEGFQARKISDKRGFWTFWQPEYDTDFMIAGTYSGLVRISRIGNDWGETFHIKGFSESSRRMHYRKGKLWIEHGYKGLYELTLNQGFSEVIDVNYYYKKAGLPVDLPYNFVLLNDEMFISTKAGFFYFDDAQKIFVKEESLNEMFEGKGFIEKVHQDEDGNLWYFSDEYMGVMRLLEDGKHIDVTMPFTRINDVFLPAFQNIYMADSRNIFIGSQTGLIHYDPSHLVDFNSKQSVYLREIAFYDSPKSNYLYFSFPLFESTKGPKIHYSHNSVVFKYTLASFENPDALKFSYRLKPFDVDWSGWDIQNFKEYTNLKEGNYTFEVKAINAHGVETPVSSFDFVIRPPFYRSAFAYSVYTFLIMLLLLANAYFVRKRLMRIKIKEKIKHEKRLAQREKLFNEQSALTEKEIIELRNESLHNEMRHKNKELANATLHLVNKNKTLSYLKDDLSKIIKQIPSDKPERQNLSNLLKKINRDLKNEQSYELFNTYFDEVHQEFVNRLKENYNDLSPKELRLCAYLRMNLSTKEIAPLMNISVRGVEISRYRLRKKLSIDHNQNLTEFLISY